MKTSEAYTMITGASMGLGKEMAIECARRGRNLILVALPDQHLQQLCEELGQSYGIRAVARECDLTDEEELNQLAAEALSHFSIDQLINNAGVGGTARFEESSTDYLDRIILLNIRATTILTRLLLPELKSHRKALVLNVASVAAFGPLPFKTIYPASKAFIYSFSRSLNKELRGTGVKVVVLTPGPILTNPDVVSRILKQGVLGRFGLLTACRISRLALDGAEKGREVIVPGLMNQLNRFLTRWIPESWRLALMARVLRKEIAVPSR
jgi:short-subunit dehydrogenase